jgi:hypothetical protein
MITQTNKKATVTITLEYDLESLRFILGEDFPESEFTERVEEQVSTDLLDYIRSHALDDWADLKIEEL